MKRKILLIQPSPYDALGEPIKKRRLYFVGLALPLLAALTPAGWEVELCLETVEDVPFDSDASVVGISSMGHGIHRSFDLARRFKELGKTVILGGPMASLVPELAGRHGDSVVVGDAEEVWAEVLADVEKGALRPRYQGELSGLDTPLPRFDLLLDKPIGDWLPVQAGRGCPHACSFCSVYGLYRGRYLRRPIEQVLRDICHVRALGFRKFLLLDDNIFANSAYLRELCGQISRLGMTWMSQCSIAIGRDEALLRRLADSGCTTLSFGLESLSRESLQAMDKGWADPAEYPALIAAVQRAGIDVSTEMVLGGEGDTLASIRETAAFIERNRIVLPRFYILTPIPGTDYFDDMQRQGRIVNQDLASYNGVSAVHQPRHMSPGELTDAYWELYDRVYSRRSIVRRTLCTANLLRRPRRQLFHTLVNLYYRHQIARRIAPNIF